VYFIGKSVLSVRAHLYYLYVSEVLFLRYNANPRIVFIMLTELTESWDNPDSIMMDYGLGSRDMIPFKGKTFSLLRNVQTRSAAHPASSPMDTRTSFPGGKVTRE
jgi:hypothetical protein